jgi:GT2 family glycosyltransferase
VTGPEPDFEELKRRLATRMAELEAAHKRILALMDKEIALRDYKQRLAAAKAERDALRGSLEYRLGRRLTSPFRKISRALLGKKKTAPEPEAEVSYQTYHRWFSEQRASDQELEEMATKGKGMRLKIGIVLAAGDASAAAVEKAIGMMAQAYPHWEMLVIGPGDLPDPPKRDSRIRLMPGVEGAISAAAVGMGSCEYVGFLNTDDWLEPDALYRMAAELEANPATDIIYADEDWLGEDKRFRDPFFKPGWAPDGLLSCNYIGRFFLIRRTLLAEVGGFRAEFESAREHDLLLRATERTDKIIHIPRVLYHGLPGESLKTVIEDALARRGVGAEVTAYGRWATYRVRRPIAKAQKITIIIPTRDRLELLKRCIDSIEAGTDYPNYEIVIADNDSREPATLDYYAGMRHRVVQYPGPFNYSAINNYAVRQTDGPWILFLNNDIEVIRPDWLANMAEHIQRPEVGAVGAKLLYPHGTIQHAGVILAERGGPATHVHVHAPGDSWENGGQIQWIGNYSAVTAGCMLTRRDLFEKVGGFDEQELPVAFNDVDYCLKLRAAGYWIVYTPFAELYHYESASRNRKKSNPEEKRILRERWPNEIARDPLTNLNLITFTRKAPGE